MKTGNALKGVLIATLVAAAALTGGCGGKSSGGVVAQPPANPADRGTLRLTNVPANTDITIDGSQIPDASGTVTVALAPGIHSVVVSRAGYTVNNSADLAQTPVAINGVTEKALSFARKEAPFPDDWVVEDAGRIAGEKEQSATVQKPIP